MCFIFYCSDSCLDHVKLQFHSPNCWVVGHIVARRLQYQARGPIQATILFLFEGYSQSTYVWQGCLQFIQESHVSLYYSYAPLNHVTKKFDSPMCLLGIGPPQLPTVTSNNLTVWVVQKQDSVIRGHKSLLWVLVGLIKAFNQQQVSEIDFNTTSRASSLMSLTGVTI